ncbi:MAG TPA: hypothetical protein VFQ61_10945 [Polyangiaceae bacterium]|nr:hypothetical protein [Polyangiaceae bacterium]
MPEDVKPAVRSSPLQTAKAWLVRHGALLAYGVLALGLLAWVAWDAFSVRLVTFGSTADYWEHSATLRALIESPFHPRNPHLVSAAPSPRFIPSFLLCALLAKAMGGDALFAMGLAASLNTTLLCLAIYAFFRGYFRSRVAALYGLLFMFASARDAFHYSNVYQLKVFFSVASYPSTTALALVLLGFAWEVRLLRVSVRRRWPELLGFSLYQAVILVTHPLTAMMTFAGVPLLALTDRTHAGGWRALLRAIWKARPRMFAKTPTSTAPAAGCDGPIQAQPGENGPSLRARAEIALTTPCSLLLAQGWPYFSVWEVLRGGQHGDEPAWLEEALSTAIKGDFGNSHLFYRWPDLSATLYLALLGVPVLLYLLARAQHLFLVLGAVAMLIPFFVNAYVPLPLGHRFVLLAIFFLQAAVVWFLLALTPGTPQTFGILAEGSTAPRRVARWMALALVLGFLGYAVELNIDKARARFESTEQRYKGFDSPVVRYCRRIAELAGPDAVVLGPADLSWPVPTFGPKVVSLLHENPLVPDAKRRIYDVKRFLDPRVQEEERLQIVQRYRVTHVLLKGNAGGQLGEFLQAHARRTALPTGKSLFTLVSAGGH